MAIIRSLAIGKAKKSAGNLTYQTVKGRTIAREKPAFVANPNTPRQQAQREKMRSLVAAWRAWFMLLKPYFTVIDGFGSAYNQFVKMNMPFAVYFDTNLKTGFVQFVDAYFSNGKYSQRALALSIAEGNLMVTVDDIQLQQDAEVGDRFVIISRGAALENPEITERVLDSTDIEAIRVGGAINTNEEGSLGDFLGVIFYSSARRTSSTLFVSM